MKIGDSVWIATSTRRDERWKTALFPQLLQVMLSGTAFHEPETDGIRVRNGHGGRLLKENFKDFGNKSHQESWQNK